MGVKSFLKMKYDHAEQDSLSLKLAGLKQKLKSDMISRASSAASYDNGDKLSKLPNQGFFDDHDDNDDNDDNNKDGEEDITLLSALQKEMEKLRDTHERLSA